jgi:hypothetical protein
MMPLTTAVTVTTLIVEHVVTMGLEIFVDSMN